MNYTKSGRVVWQGSEGACQTYANDRVSIDEHTMVRPCLPKDLTDPDSVEDVRNMWEVAVVSHSTAIYDAAARIAELSAEIADLQSTINRYEGHLL